MISYYYKQSYGSNNVYDLFLTYVHLKGQAIFSKTISSLFDKNYPKGRLVNKNQRNDQLSKAVQKHTVLSLT